MATIQAESHAIDGKMTLDVRVRIAVILITSVLLCSYALLWNLSVVHYYAMLSDPRKLAEEMIAPSARILGHILLLPCFVGMYFAATSEAWMTGRAVTIALKQTCLLVTFALLVRPILYLACYLANTGDVVSLNLDTLREFMDLDSWMSTALNYSLVYALGLFLILGFVMFSKYRQEQLRASAMRANWLQARLETLRANLHPHFLFNTLNTISSLVTSRPEEARDLISELAALLRDSILEKDSEFCPLGQECELAEKYLRIISVRFGERFKSCMDVPESLKSRSVPRGLLLTLIENAVTHGVYVLTGECVLSVTCLSRDGCVVVEVRNRYGRRAASSSGHQGGLTALDTRLQALYGSGYRLEYGGDEAEIWCTRVALPVTGLQAECEPECTIEGLVQVAIPRRVQT